MEKYICVIDCEYFHSTYLLSKQKKGFEGYATSVKMVICVAST